jgi:hypothetical protein
MKRIFSASRYANVTATLALAIALGGTSYAAGILPVNSVGNRQLRSSAVTTGKVKNGSLLKADFRTGQLPRGLTGAAGPRGLTGLTGAPGAPGAPGVPALDYNVSDLFENLNGEQSSGIVSCDPGMFAVGGGVIGESLDVGQDINSTGPSPSGSEWLGYVDNQSGTDSSFSVYVICTRASAVTRSAAAEARPKR